MGDERQMRRDLAASDIKPLPYIVTSCAVVNSNAELSLVCPIWCATSEGCALQSARRNKSWRVNMTMGSRNTMIMLKTD
eukprot:8552756-Pyramimonas_sp.AAC.1